ncbi:MAG: DUF4956 domain-containing protein [Oscillospiraceae bacterium]|jgi:hypothetical protein|nr:DUF4956 domain-containing protein [Oscillospiraceae bacterium]
MDVIGVFLTGGGNPVGDLLGDMSTSGSTLTLGRIIATLIVAFVAGLIIFFVYKAGYKGVVYSHAFNVSLTLSCVITSVIVIAISSNIALSLGMVGALSIVRFRAAIKDPVDIIFLFWAISTGIVAGTGEFGLLAIATVLIGIAATVLFRVKSRKASYLLILDVQAAYAREFHGAIRKRLNVTMKSKSLIRDRAELVYELRMHPDADTSFIDELQRRPEVQSAVLVGYNGDYAE